MQFFISETANNFGLGNRFLLSFNATPTKDCSFIMKHNFNTEQVLSFLCLSLFIPRWGCARGYLMTQCVRKRLRQDREMKQVKGNLLPHTGLEISYWI